MFLFWRKSMSRLYSLAVRGTISPPLVTTRDWVSTTTSSTTIRLSVL